MAQTHKSMIQQAGQDRGYNLASWVDMPELGSTVWTESDGKVTITKDNQADVWLDLCYDAESNGRQYSPFEFTARELNNLQSGSHAESRWYCAEIVPYPENGSALPAKSYDVWEVYDLGIEQGIAQYYQEHYTD